MFKVWEEIGKQEMICIANDFLASLGARGRFQEGVEVGLAASEGYGSESYLGICFPGITLFRCVSIRMYMCICVHT